MDGVRVVQTGESRLETHTDAFRYPSSLKDIRDVPFPGIFESIVARGRTTKITCIVLHLNTFKVLQQPRSGSPTSFRTQ